MSPPWANRPISSPALIHHFFAGGELLVLLCHAIDVLACAYGDAAGRRGSDAGRPT